MQKPRLLMLAGLLAIVFATEAMATEVKMDFNKDGYTDLAIGAPGATVDGKKAGSVTVIYGNAAGLSSATDSEVWVKGKSGVPGTPQDGDGFGSALAAGDFNNDGYVDLAIGVPGKSTVVVLYGWGGGLIGKHIVCGTPCPPQPSVFKMNLGGQEEFGFALAAGDFNRDYRADLAVGAPSYTAGSRGNEIVRTGAVVIYYGSVSGLTETGSQFLSKATAGIVQKDNDRFGYSLAVSNFGKSLAQDLAIGAPGLGSVGRTGGVHVFYGGEFKFSRGQYNESTPGFVGGGNQFWDENAISGKTKYDEAFGYALAAGDFGNGSVFQDLAIGIPRRKVGQKQNAGAVRVLFGSLDGLSTAGNQEWNLDSSGVTGSAQPYDYFGSALAAGNYGKDFHDDLAIGVPGHPVKGSDNAGVVSVLFGGFSGLTANYEPLLQPYIVDENIFFGSVLSAKKFNGDNYTDLAIGIPEFAPGPMPSFGAVDIRYSTGEKGCPPRPQICSGSNTVSCPAIRKRMGASDSLCRGENKASQSAFRGKFRV